jgi:phosphatidylinositol alpha-mannosyltransferase
VHFLSAELAALGHDVTVVTSRAPRADRERAVTLDAELQERSGYRTVRLGTSVPVRSNGSIARVTLGPGLRGRLARALAPADVVHAQGLAGPLLALEALRASRAPCTVGTFHTYFEGEHLGMRIGRAYIAGALARLDRRIAVSPACVMSLQRYFPGEWDIVPNGIDTGMFTPVPDEEERAPGPPRILFVGRFDPRNGLHTLLDAARLLHERGLEFEVQVVGDGPARPRYERQAQRLGIQDRVRWLGLLNHERPELYRQATVLAAPCTLASFGVVLLEAFASGIPIVCADNIGFRQVLRDGAPGRFVPGHDPLALADGIDAVLADGALRRDWAVRGRRVAEERYSWPEVTRRIEAIYREVLGARGAVRSTPRVAGRPA